MARRARWLIGLAAVAAAFLAPAGAEASLAGKDPDNPNTILIVDDVGEANDIQFDSKCCFWITEITDTAGIEARDGCEQQGNFKVTCGQTQTGTDVLVGLGDGNDRLNFDVGPEIRSVSADLGPGGDRMSSGSGDDAIDGGDGNDTIHASGGGDQVEGGPGDDSVAGGSGSDTVSGGSGRDLIEGDATTIYTDGGSDTLLARDGEADQVTCGYGSDVVTGDAIDTVEGDGECERVDLAAAPGSGAGPGSGTGPGATGPVITATARSTQRLGRAGSVAVSGGCDRDCVFAAAGTVSFPGNAKTFRLNRVKRSLRAGQRATLKLKLSRKALAAVRRALRRGKRVTAKIRATATSAGASTSVTRRVRLRR